MTNFQFQFIIKTFKQIKTRSHIDFHWADILTGLWLQSTSQSRSGPLGWVFYFNNWPGGAGVANPEVVRLTIGLAFTGKMVAKNHARIAKIELTAYLFDVLWFNHYASFALLKAEGKCFYL